MLLRSPLVIVLCMYCLNGFQCTACDLIYRNVKRMQWHCCTEHNWQPSRQRRAGRPAGTHSMWTSNVSCQKLHGTSILGILFQIYEAVESRNLSTIISEDSSRWGYQAWLNRTGWARHLKGLNRE
ncbi:hypothetical protein GGP41_008241 [Bipolaris sorokiniana]|uniref:C2H2-type domain-containing protein n=1 Tax=Cochliobolus sativus TaxID=45130 RepID=A0A8H5ZM58_COCSA|nr:hypothetical protein GGP41_008241 [Bipolaris sorokiniana]